MTTKLNRHDKISKIEDLRKEIARLKHELDEVKSARTVASEEITSREKGIIDHIRRNPGINKQHVIDWGTSSSIGSRATIFKAIDKLEKSGIIEVDKGKPNSIIHKLYINNDSVLLILVEELDGFENIFPALIEKIKIKIETKEESSSNVKFKGVTQQDQDQLKFFAYFLVVYQQFIGMLVYHAIYTWPALLNDDENILKRLYATLFSRLRKIQLNLTNAFKTDKPYDNYSIDVSKTMAQRFFVLQPEYIKYLHDMAKRYDAINEIENLLDVVWKISRSFFKYSMWAHPPPPELQKDNSSFAHRDINGKKLYELNPGDWRGLLKE